MQVRHVKSGNIVYSSVKYRRWSGLHIARDYLAPIAMELVSEGSNKKRGTSKIWQKWKSAGIMSKNCEISFRMATTRRPIFRKEQEELI